MRVILVPVADRPESKIALDAAFVLATQLGGNVVGCHVRPHRDDELPRRGFVIPDRAWNFTPQPGDSEMHSKAASKLFASLAERHGFEQAKKARLGQDALALWKEMVGTPAKVFGIIGPVADVAVLSRPRPKSAGRAEAFLLSALLNSGKPVLVLPQRHRAPVGKRVLIAWNQSPEAAAAVSASLGLLRKAEKVTIAVAGKEHRPGPKSTYLAEYLAHWGIRAGRVATRGRDVDRELTDAFKETESDLLLMGAYSRSRLRELVFGGVTETMLFKTDFPVLMLHR